jgi:CheY-like chemotaxis protein
MPPAAHAHHTILVVEDNDVSREGLAVVLRRAGYRVIPAANGGEALAALRSEPPPDLILLDMFMPVVDGWHFLDRLRHEAVHPPVILTTGAAVLSREWAEAHGCAGFLRKPVDSAALLDEVARCLGGRAPGAATV